MKKTLYLILTVSGLTASYGQNVSFIWAKQMAGMGYWSASNSMATDAAGNIYTTGAFVGIIDFDPGPGVHNLSSLSPGTSSDVFVCKWNAAGDLVWVKQMGASGGTGSAGGGSIAVDASGNVFVLGNFAGIVDFDPGPAVFNLSSSSCGFLCKLDAAGNFVWAKQLDPQIMLPQGGRSIVPDASGNIYLTGSFYGTADFDPGPGLFNLSSGAGGTDREIFVAKYNTAGNLLWAGREGGVTAADGGDGYGITVDPAGFVYTSGSVHGIVDLDPGPGVFNLTEAGSGTFISKLDASGNLIWAKELTTGDLSQATLNYSAIACNSLNHIFVSVGSILWKLDGSGTFFWTYQLAGSNGQVYYSSLAADASDNVYSIGNFNDVMEFQPELCPFSLATAGDFDIFVTRLNGDGKLAWAKQFGGAGLDLGTSIVVDPAANVFTTGSFTGVVDFDPAVPVYNLNGGARGNAFVHKMGPCSSASSSVLKVATCNSYTLNCKLYSSTGIYTQTVSSALGCDSIITLDLTILNNNSKSTADVTACGKYAWQGKILTSSGTYTDTLKIASGCDSILILNLTVNPESASSIVQTICPGQTFEGYSTPGVYTDTFQAANGCDSLRTIYLSMVQPPSPDLGPDSYICPGDTLSLFPGDYPDYVWQDGSTGSHFTVHEAGRFSVNVSNQCGSKEDDIVISANTCTILFPNAFTPNNDGKNELFKILNTPRLTDYDLSVYNRWGQKVFETTDYSKGWDGKANGQYAEMGVYVYFCRFKKPGDLRSTERKGTVFLLR